MNISERPCVLTGGHCWSIPGPTTGRQECIACGAVRFVPTVQEWPKQPLRPKEPTDGR